MEVVWASNGGDFECFERNLVHSFVVDVWFLLFAENRSDFQLLGSEIGNDHRENP